VKEGDNERRDIAKEGQRERERMKEGKNERRHR
jgi:hypothetical protein